jgi:hypothetical protein
MELYNENTMVCLMLANDATNEEKILGYYKNVKDAEIAYEKYKKQFKNASVIFRNKENRDKYFKDMDDMLVMEEIPVYNPNKNPVIVVSVKTIYDEEKNSYITWDDNVCINVCDWEDMFLQPVQKPFGSGFNLLKKIDGFEVNNLFQIPCDDYEHSDIILFGVFTSHEIMMDYFMNISVDRKK